MPTVSPEPSSSAGQEPRADRQSGASREPRESYQAREMAESFGAEPARYDRVRPRYPEELIARIAAAAPGPELLDVGCGTGIVARQFRAHGCRVLGVDPDGRMVDFAREHGGVDAEVARFESWDAGGRRFDAIVAGQTWHWVDPDPGAAKAAELLRPGGRLALFWNVFRPAPELAAVFADCYRAALPDAPRNPWARPVLDAYAGILAKVAESVRRAGGFEEPEQSRVDWERVYTRDEWLDQLRTGGDTAGLNRDQLGGLLARFGAAVDALGGSFSMGYAAVVVEAERRRTG